MVKLLCEEKPVSDKVAQLVMRSQTDYVTRTIDMVIFVQGRRGELPGTGDQIAQSARLTAVTGCYLVPLLSRMSPMAHAIARMVHDRHHTASAQFIGREIRTQYYINRLTPYLKMIARTCFTCQKLNQDLVKVEHGPLPSFRHLGSTPNLVIATDMLGPYHVQHQGVEMRGAGT